MESQKEELFKKLYQKTAELGRQVTFSEMSEDQAMPSPNNYAYYYGSFTEAAKEAYQTFTRGDELVAVSEVKGVREMSKKPARTLSPERTEAVISEIVDMFIVADGEMPSARAIKKNRFISEEEVAILRKNGEIRESSIRRMAEERSGKKFLTPEERRKKAIVEKKEVAKMEEKKERRGIRYTPEEATEKLRKACREARHVLTQAEVKGLSEDGVVPGWVTLQKQVGPWFLWGEMFNVPFSNEKQENAARKLKEEYLEKEKDRKEAEERFAEKQKAEEPKQDEMSNEEIDKLLSSIPADKEPKKEDFEPEVTIEEPEVPVERDDGMVEYPIMLTLPKGIKAATVRLTLKF